MLQGSSMVPLAGLLAHGQGLLPLWAASKRSSWMLSAKALYNSSFHNSSHLQQRQLRQQREGQAQQQVTSFPQQQQQQQQHCCSNAQPQPQQQQQQQQHPQLSARDEATRNWPHALAPSSHSSSSLSSSALGCLNTLPPPAVRCSGLLAAPAGISRLLLSTAADALMPQASTQHTPPHLKQQQQQEQQLPLHTASAASGPTAARAAAAGVLLSSFQGSRYTGSSSLSQPGRYWLRQMGMDDSRVTALLVAANTLCFGMQQVSPTFTAYCVRVGYKVAAGEYWRLLTPVFVHHNFLHFGVNTLALWNIGRALEPQLGSRTFTAVYLGSAISGNLLGYWMNSYVMSLGSSSALFGLLGAFLSTSFINRHSVYVSRAQVTSVLQSLGLNLGLMLLFGGAMDNWAHLGGFLGGGALAAVLGPRYGR